MHAALGPAPAGERAATAPASRVKRWPRYDGRSPREQQQCDDRNADRPSLTDVELRIRAEALPLRGNEARPRVASETPVLDDYRMPYLGRPSIKRIPRSGSLRSEGCISKRARRASMATSMARSFLSPR